MQVTVAWGAVNCAKTATTAPIFSIGYGSSLANCPAGTATKNHSYEMSIQYDFIVTKEWYFEVFDQTSGTYILSQYVANQQGTYVKSDNFGVVMEGICGVQSQCPTGTYIPNGNQGFGPYGFNFATECNPNYSCANNWVQYTNYASGSGGGWLPPPANLVQTVGYSSGYIYKVYWT